MTFDNTAALLGERIEAVAVALHRAGVPPDRSATMLAAAVAAAIRALRMHPQLDEPPAELPRAA
jgi:hypothetical protein